MSMRRESRSTVGSGVALLVMVCGPAQPLMAQRSVIPDRARDYGTVAEVSARLDSLEQVVRVAPSQAARLEALIRVLQIGRARAYIEGSPPLARYPGVLERLRRIYPTLDSPSRGVIVRGLPTIAERSEALGWLALLTKSSEMADGHIPIAAEAVEALARMGPAGEDELRRLHLSGEADPALQKMLDALARTGYRRPPGGR